jgi:hypothetical protein
MFSSIGTKRLMLLIIAAGACAAFTFYTYVVMLPQEKTKKAEYDGLSSQITEARGNIEKMKGDLVTFETQKQLFEKLNKIDFMNDQNRVLTRERFETLQTLSKTVSTKYEIKAASIVEDELSANTGYVRMTSPISVSVAAIDDLDIYRFIYYLNYAFPGGVTITNIVMQRSADVTPELLKQIGTGKPPTIVTASIELVWTTMAKKDLIPPEILAEAARLKQEGGQ